MKQIEDYFFYKLFAQYSATCKRIENIKQDAEFLAIIAQIKTDLAAIFKKHKINVGKTEWNYFDANLMFSPKFWGKISKNTIMLEDYNHIFTSSVEKVDSFKQNLLDIKNNLRLDMWAHSNTIPVELFIGGDLVPVYYFIRSLGDNREDEAIEIAQHLWHIGFNKVEIRKCSPRPANKYKPEYSFMIFANVKPEYSTLLLNAWPIGGINETPHWLYPMIPSNDMAQLAELPYTVFDDYLIEGE